MTSTPSLVLTERELLAIYGQLQMSVTLGSRLPVTAQRELRYRAASEQQTVTDEDYLTRRETSDAYERLRDFLFPPTPPADAVEIEVRR